MALCVRQSMSVVSSKEYGGRGANGDYGVRSAKANAASPQSPGSCVLVPVLPFPAGRSHSSGEDGMSALPTCSDVAASRCVCILT